jgi:serine phosphatase RsbU (regulator of sigma subunit)
LLEQLAAHAGPAVQVAHLLLKQKAEALERERMEYEMSLARSIQQTLLPLELPALAGWRSAAYYRPARSVGGDFYDFLPLPGGQMGIFIGDVTDKGIPAALVMASTRSILRSITLEGISPAQVLEKANNLLVPDMPPSMFVTCLFLLFDPATGRVRYANAGHNLPMQWRGEEVAEWRATGMPLGLMPGMQYEEKEAQLHPGEGLLLYTDGVVEAHNPEGEMFGVARLREALKWYSLAHEGAIQALIAELDLFTGPAWEQEDDVTLVVISGDGGNSSVYGNGG